MASFTIQEIDPVRQYVAVTYHTADGDRTNNVHGLEADFGDGESILAALRAYGEANYGAPAPLAPSVAALIGHHE